MSNALRELLASFVIEVDKAGELAKGNLAIDALKGRLGELQAEFNKVRAPAEQAGKAIRKAFEQGMGGFGSPDLAAALKQQSQNKAYSLFGGFGAQSGNQDHASPIGPQREFGPTRETLNSARAATAQAEAAAAKYATTLKGRLAGAVKAVRDGFNSSGGGEGPGLIASLATVRNGFLALGAGAAVRGVKHLVDGIGDIKEGAQSLGVTTDQFQRLSVLAAQNGTSVGALGTAFRNLSNAAVQPTKDSSAALKELGVTVKDNVTGQFKSANDLFFDTTAALAGVTDETKRNNLAQTLLGRSALELKPLFSEGTAAVNEQRAALAKLNVLSEETINQADGVSDSWKSLGLLAMVAAEPIIKLLIPALAHLTEWMFKGVEAATKFLKQTDLVSVGLTALAGVVAFKLVPGFLRLLPTLKALVELGGGWTKTLSRMAGEGAKAAFSFLAWAIPAAIIEDFIGFLRGDESAIGEALDMVFGKGASTGVIEALGKAWDLLAGAVKRVLEALHLFKPDDLDLEQRDRADKAYEGSNFQRNVAPVLKGLGDAILPGLGTLGGKAADWITSSTASAGYGSSVDYGTIPAPGPPMMSSEQLTSPAPNVSIGDTHVEITMSPSASAPDVGRAVVSAVSSEREQLMSTVQSY